jgi:hypothetical protein
MNDLNNFAMFHMRHKQRRGQNSMPCMNYRKQLGSSNFDGNFDMRDFIRKKNYQQVVTYQNMTLLLRQEVELYEMSTQTSATLQMFGLSKNQGAQKYLRSMLQSTHVRFYKKNEIHNR